MEEEVAVLGAGSWGTALAVMLGGCRKRVRMWARSGELAELLSRKKENKKYLPGVPLPGALDITSDLSHALHGVRVVVLAVPSQNIREVVRLARPFLNRDCLLVNTAKGLESPTCLRVSQVVEEELPEYTQKIAVLSGPSHAEEVSREMPTAVVVAARSQEVAQYIQDVFMTPNFRVYTSSDLVGVELGGALKNIIALGTGIAEGLGYGDNTKAALITRGLAEITRLGIALGANPLTFLGLTGVGDLIVTATSAHSRNRRAGLLLGQGRSLDETLQKVGMVVEGVETTRAARQLSRRFGIEMPITEKTYEVLFSGLSPRTAVSNLMLRSKCHEAENVPFQVWGR